MKKIVSFASAVFVFAAMGLSQVPSAFAQELKIGYVDLARVFDEYLKTKDFDKSLEAKGTAKQGDRDKMVSEIKKLRDEAELLSAKAKDEKQAVIDERIKSLQEFDRATRDALRKERDGIVRDILKEIETVIDGFGKSQGYSFIFNDRVLVYKSEGNDLTPQVIKVLNDSYTAKKK
ncbi:MAG: OmpH family outer membrane protein [Candidatus Omnitrophica bacterium]|nr:OmpH family outer membrane protein [Candidatus Omnitrophota bacterium]